MDPEVVGRLLGYPRQHDPVADLTHREQQVVRLMAEGKSNQGIADELVVTISAVERRVTRIFSRLGLPRDSHEPGSVLAVLQCLHRQPDAVTRLPRGRVPRDSPRPGGVSS